MKGQEMLVLPLVVGALVFVVLTMIGEDNDRDAWSENFGKQKMHELNCRELSMVLDNSWFESDIKEDAQNFYIAKDCIEKGDGE